MQIKHHFSSLRSVIHLHNFVEVVKQNEKKKIPVKCFYEINKSFFVSLLVLHSGKVIVVGSLTKTTTTMLSVQECQYTET